MAVHGKSFPSCTKQKHPTDVECFCFGNRRRRVVICAFLRPRRSRGVVLPCAQSLLSAAGKCKPFRRSAFLTNYPRLLSFSLAGCFFHTSFAKEKNSHKRASFFFWKPASTYSPGHVSASHIVLFFAARHRMPSALACAQCVPFRVVKMRRRSPRSSFLRNYRVARSFSLRGARVLRPRAPMLLQDENNVLSCVTYNSSQPCAQHLGRTRQIVFGAELQNKKLTQ